MYETRLTRIFETLRIFLSYLIFSSILIFQFLLLISIKTNVLLRFYSLKIDISYISSIC